MCLISKPAGQPFPESNKLVSISAGLVLYMAYLLLENALVGWVTILLELFVAIVLMAYKLWLDYWHRCDLFNPNLDLFLSLLYNGAVRDMSEPRQTNPHSRV